MGPFDRFNDRAKRVELSKVRTSVEFIIGRGDATTSPSEITLSPRTKKIIELAIDEARKLGHSHVGTEHLLLGLVREGEGVAARVLNSVGVTLEKVRHQVIATLGQSGGAGQASGAASTSSAPSRTYTASAIERLDDAAKRVLALAMNEAVGLGHTWLGTDHLLLGLISVNGTLAQRALNELGVTLDKARELVAKAERPGAEWQTPATVLTPRANRLVDAAANLAGHGPVRPECLLLAYAADQESAGSRILATLGAAPDKVRAAVDRLTQG